MEYVETTGCESPAAADRYYERLGGLVALAYVLGGTDLHFENLVASGDQPVLVDLETILTPGDPPERHPEPTPLAPTYRETVLETSLVPVVPADGSGERTVAGLREPSVESAYDHQPVFANVNTDGMELSFTRDVDPSGRNLPVVDGEQRQPEAHLDALTSGFETVARAVRDSQESFSTVLAEAFDGATMRFMYRQTMTYGAHLLRNTYSSHLRSGLRTGLQTEALCRPFVDGQISDATHWRLVAAERAAIARRDVPRFTVEADGRTVCFDGEPVSSVAVSPLDRARGRVDSLDADAIATQVGLLALPFSQTEIPPSLDESSPTPGGPVAPATSPEDVVSMVVETVADTVVSRPAGGVTWPDVAGPRLAGAVTFGEPGIDLYDGYTGVGLFLAAVASVRGDDDVRQLARDVLAPVREAVESSRGLVDLGPGGVVGVGSVVYGLSRAGALLGDADLVECARTAGHALDREAVADDDAFGVIDGSAGELLGNLALYDETGDDAALERAVWCGEHLLANRVEAETGHRVWRGEAFERPLSGFSHGAAGIGYALGRLADATDRTVFHDAAREALAFERALFERDDGWADRRSDVPGETDGTGAWCHGRPGVGVGRVGVHADVSGIDAGWGLRRATERRSTAASFEDSLCCGTAGRVRFLQTASEHIDAPVLAADADAMLAALLSRASEEGSARLKGHTPDVPRLSLFNGLAGVGYAALGSEAEPGEIPELLRLA